MEERRVKFFKTQYDAFNFTTQFGAAVAGVQSGKTFLGAHWAGKKILEFPQGVGVIVAPTYKILHSATLKKFFDIFPELRTYYKEQKGQLLLPTGGSVYIRSADNPLGIEGITADWIWGDEAGQYSLLTWTILRSRVAMTRGQIFFTTTPYNLGWMYTDFFIPCKDKTDPSLSFFTWKSTDNPAFSTEYFEQERRRLRPEEFARRYEGKFEKMQGLVYDITTEHQCELLEVTIKTEARILGVDWGFRNPASLVVLYQRDSVWHVVDEWKQSERTNPEIIQVIKTKIQDHKIDFVYPDPAEPDRIEECRRAGVPVMEVSKDIKGGISFVQELLRTKRLKVCNNMKQILDEASMYHYPEAEDGKASKDEPVKFNDHLLDAMRYALYSHKGGKLTYGKATSPIKPYYAELGI